MLQMILDICDNIISDLFKAIWLLIPGKDQKWVAYYNVWFIKVTKYCANTFWFSLLL